MTSQGYQYNLIDELKNDEIDNSLSLLQPQIDKLLNDIKNRRKQLIELYNIDNHIFDDFYVYSLQKQNEMLIIMSSYIYVLSDLLYKLKMKR